LPCQRGVLLLWADKFLAPQENREYLFMKMPRIDFGRRCAALVLLLSLALSMPLAASAATSVSATRTGLASLTYNGAQYLGRGQDCYLRKLVFQGTSPTAAGAGILTVTTGKNQVALSRAFAWGTLTCTYSAQQDRLTENVVINNRSPNTIGEIGVQAVSLATQSGPVLPMFGSEYNLGGPQVFFIPYGGITLSLANEEVQRPLSVLVARIPGGLGIFLDSRVPRVLPAKRGGGAQRQAPIDRAIRPGSSDTYSLSMRFADKSVSPAVVLGDLFRRWAARFPPNFNWPDRRPIGQLVLANYGRQLPFNPNNPRYWRFVDPKLDVNSEQGRVDFKNRLLRFADSAVATLKDIGAQGVIAWDIEGEEFINLQYVGDPHYLPPEMQGVVDQFFRRFTDQGLRCGLTLAVRRILSAASGPGSSYPLTAASNREYLENPDDLFDFLDQNLSYAKRRWGCTLYYIDADGTAAWPSDVSVFRRLAAKYPDVLLIPEQKTLTYYASTAPYCQDTLGRQYCGSDDARWLYPRAFSVIKVFASPVPKPFTPMNLSSRVGGGDVLLITSWAGPQHPQVRVPMAIMQSAGRVRAARPH
jgi:hypothetical protein